MKKLLVVLCVMALALPVFGETVFRIANGAEPQSLDPHMITGVPEHRIYQALFEGLMIASPATGNPVNGMAESYTVSADQKTYTFKLRKGLKWSDGVPITARTVYDSWIRNLNPETASGYASLMTDVIAGAADYNAGKTGPDKVQIKVVDLETFQFTCTGPAPYAVAMLTHYVFAVVPMHAIKSKGADWTLPENWVSNGPFVLKEHTPQDKIVVVKNPNYWDAKNVKIDQIVFYAAEDYATTYKMYLNGEIDWNCNPPPTDKVAEAKARAQKDFLITPELGIYYYEFNMQIPPFNDVRVRKAFSMVGKRQEMADKITQAGQIPALALTPAFAGYTPPKGYAEDEEAAKKLLADAGYPGGKGFPTITLIYNTSSTHKKIAEYFQQRFEQVLGVKVVLENQEWATYLETRKDGKMGGKNLARAGWIADYQDPYNFLFMFKSSNFDFNDTRWNNPKYDQLVAQANGMPAGAERNAVFAQAEKILIEDDVVIMPIYYYVTQNMIDTNKWGGWSTNLLDSHAYKFIYKK
jgi:oligopeptide transport system substrate-binding protein